MRIGNCTTTKKFQPLLIALKEKVMKNLICVELLINFFKQFHWNLTSLRAGHEIFFFDCMGLIQKTLLILLLIIRCVSNAKSVKRPIAPFLITETSHANLTGGRTIETNTIVRRSW